MPRLSLQRDGIPKGARADRQAIMSAHFDELDDQALSAAIDAEVEYESLIFHEPSLDQDDE